MHIIGINAFHGDSAAAIVKDGSVLAAVEEERFTRIKHWAGLPIKSIRFCLDHAGIGPDEIDHIAINSDNRAHRWKKVGYVLRTVPSLRLLLSKLSTRQARGSVISMIKSGLGAQLPDVQLHHIEHHRAHLASAFYPSPFDQAAVLSVDGFGDFSSGAWGRGDGAGLRVDGYTHFPHSMGLFYQAVTQFLGFPNYGDEYKVMGLASYGQPRFQDRMGALLSSHGNLHYRLGLEYLLHHRQPISYQWSDGVPVFERLYTPELENLLGPARKPDEPIEQRHQDIAASTQAVYEQVFLNLLSNLHKEYGSDNLALAGGCAMNSVANGKILARTGFKRVYVQPAAGDAGGAVGAALEVWKELNGAFKQAVMPDAYLGPSFDDDAIATLLAEREQPMSQAGCQVEKCTGEELCERVARRLVAGDVVGWFQGRMEWGPRALGNRSILADPRRDDMQQILNRKIKRRESFRPFAPSILRERVSEWFEVDDDVPYMQKVYRIKSHKAGSIPAVTHVDGTGRLQTVYRDTNERFYTLIEEFEKLTDVPMLLNTSFNENEPIVCHPAEALDCFLRTRMDLLVLGNYFIIRKRDS